MYMLRGVWALTQWLARMVGEGAIWDRRAACISECILQRVLDSVGNSKQSQLWSLIRTAAHL